MTLCVGVRGFNSMVDPPVALVVGSRTQDAWVLVTEIGCCLPFFLFFFPPSLPSSFPSSFICLSTIYHAKPFWGCGHQ